jgi:small subunit ribosomal protein S6
MESTHTVAAHRAREYETIYILRPNAGEEAAEKVATRVVDTVTRLDGKLVEVEVWGRRRLAYKIKGNAKGVFIYLRYLGYPGLVEELERNLRMLDAVLKYQSVKLADEIDPSTVEVDPEAVKFEGMDFSEEPDEDVDYDDEDERGADAAYLDYEPELMHGRDDDDLDGMDDDDDDLGVPRDFVAAPVEDVDDDEPSKDDDDREEEEE